jgi:hypothetical protein
MLREAVVGLAFAMACQPALGCQPAMLPPQQQPLYAGEPAEAVAARQKLANEVDLLISTVSQAERELSAQKAVWARAEFVVLVEVFDRPINAIRRNVSPPGQPPVYEEVLVPVDDIRQPVALRAVATLKGKPVQGDGDLFRQGMNSCGGVSPDWDVLEGKAGGRFLLYLSAPKVVQDNVIYTVAASSLVDPVQLAALAAKVR